MQGFPKRGESRDPEKICGFGEAPNFQPQAAAQRGRGHSKTPGATACKSTTFKWNKIRGFLALSRWKLPDASVPGITWIELLAAFEVTGHVLEPSTKDRRTKDKATPLLSLKNTLRLFRQLTFYVTNNFRSSIDAICFHSTRVATRRLQPSTKL